MDLSREKNVGEGGITWNEDRKALTRIGVEFNYGEVENELWLTVELVWWFDLVVRVRWSGCTALRMKERVGAKVGRVVRVRFVSVVSIELILRWMWYGRFARWTGHADLECVAVLANG